MPKLLHYRNKCIGCGICHEQQPQFWRMSKKDGKATLLKAVLKRDVHVLEVNEWDIDEEVIKACPVKVIKAV
jgi:ferredoxin